MKKVSFFLIFAASFFLSCGDGPEQKAQALVAEAVEAFETQEYGRAKMLLDSVKSTYPKAFKAHREALKLSRDVELGEQNRSLDYFNAEIAVMSQRRDSLLPGFVLEKDRRYQDTGNYMKASQTVKNNLGNTYLRAQVGENGVATLSSVYRGKAMSHNRVRVTAGDTYVECDSPFNTYSSKHLGVTTERLDFRYKQDGGLMDFIAASSSQPITVELSGKGTHKYRLRGEDAIAIAEVLELAVVLQAIDSLNGLRDEAHRHIEFLKRSKERFESDSLKR